MGYPLDKHGWLKHVQKLKLPVKSYICFVLFMICYGISPIKTMFFRHKFPFTHHARQAALNTLGRAAEPGSKAQNTFKVSYMLIQNSKRGVCIYVLYIYYCGNYIIYIYIIVAIIYIYYTVICYFYVDFEIMCVPACVLCYVFFFSCCVICMWIRMISPTKESHSTQNRVRTISIQHTFGWCDHIII